MAFENASSLQLATSPGNLVAPDDAQKERQAHCWRIWLASLYRLAQHSTTLTRAQLRDPKD